MPALPVVVYQEWLDAEGMAEWMCPHPCFTWSCSTWQPPANSIVTVTLEPHGHEQTMMTIHHAKLPPELVEDHRNGWNKISDQIQDWLTTRARR